MSYTMDNYTSAVQYLIQRLGTGWQVGIITGTGLACMEGLLCEKTELPYADIPGMGCSTAPSHRGVLLGGQTPGGVRVLLFSGRLHQYEGYSAEQIAFPVRVMHLLGIKTLLLLNGTGCLNPNWDAGDYMAITGHLSFGMESPCTGPGYEAFGPRFFDAAAVWDPALVHLAQAAAKQCGVRLRRGTYAYMPGPQYESPEEVRALRLLGGDCVGMSTVQEACAAAHCGMRALGISHLANYAAGLATSPLECGVVENDKTPLVHMVAQVLQELAPGGAIPGPGMEA